MTEHPDDRAPDGGPAITPGAERTTDAATPSVPKAPGLPVGLMSNAFPATSPTGPQLGVQLAVGNPENGQQYLTTIIWVPEDQAEAWAEGVLNQVRDKLEEIRRARLGAPVSGLALPGSPGFGLAPPPNPNGHRTP